MGINRRNTENQNRKTTVTDTFITYNGIPCTDNTDIANNLNTYFTTVGNTLVEVCDGGWFMVVVIYPDSLQTNSAHKVKYTILLSFV